MNEKLTDDGPWRPDARFDDPDLLATTLQRRVLPFVSSPGRYIGGELGARRDGFDPDKANLLLAFPDAYEVGMSHQGLRILYSLLGGIDSTFCDLAFTPWPDMEARMRAEGLPLFGLESRRPVGQFDLVGFSLGYELAYTNLLTMIDLAGSPLLAAERTEDDPIYVAGGACTLNPAVVGPLLDVIFLGDGEETIMDAARIVAEGKATGKCRDETLALLREIPGAWHPGRTEVARARILTDLNRFEPPHELVPMIEPVHDRLALEVMRGCVRGCRFCQAGMITRPVRERNPEALIEAAAKGVTAAGYGEVSLLSLSTSDYSGLTDTVIGIQDTLPGPHTNLVLPSLRVDSLDEHLYERISRERPANFTFAPEAGSQRLRDVINKQISEEEILAAVGNAFKSGVKGVKLYFMIGLPTETNDDLDELIALVGRVVGIAPRGGSQIHVSISPFAPKAHTPFQWSGQIPRDEIRRRNAYLDKRLQRLRVKVSLRNPEISYLECVLGLGDENLTRSLIEVWRLGARFDGWSEYFDFARWQQAFDAAGLDADAYTQPRDPETRLPWDGVSVGLEKSFLQKDWKRAQRGGTLPDCRLEDKCYKCDACGDTFAHIFADRPAAGQVDAADSAAEPGATSADPEAFDPRNADPRKPETEVRKWQVWRQQAAAKCWYRIEFAKTGDMVWLGHLDFQRQMQLALRRSGLPVAYSKGYHPHPLFKFGPPLSVTVAGLRETMDLALDGQVPGWIADVNATLPAGLRIRRSLVVGGQTPPSIEKSVHRQDFRIEIPAPADGGPDPDELTSLVDAFLASETWLYERKRPKGNIEIDVRAQVILDGPGLKVEVTRDEGAVLQVALRRNTDGASLPVHDFLTALAGEVLPETGLCRITRLGYYGRRNSGGWLSPFEEVGERSRRYWFQRRMAD